MSEDIKDTIELNFKYRDYKTAFELIDQPYYQHLQPWVFEHWVKTLLQESTADDKVINERIRMNFIKMKQSLAEQLDIDLLHADDMNKDLNKENVPIEIDFTDLAKIASKNNYPLTSKFLIE